MSAVERKRTDYEDKGTADKYVLGIVSGRSEKRHLRLLLNNPKGRNILDLGCGNGWFTNALHTDGASCIGIDHSEEFISRASRDFDGPLFMHMDARNLRIFPANSFDTIVMLSVLPNIPTPEDMEAIFQECAHALREGGELVFSAVNPASIHNHRDLLRIITVAGDGGGEDLPPGTRYEGKYRLADEESWITFTNSHWPTWYIREVLLRNDFTITDIVPHTPGPDEVPERYVESLKREPIHVFYRCLYGPPDPRDTLLRRLEDKTPVDPKDLAMVPYEGPR